MYSCKKVTNTKPFIPSQDQTDIIQMVSTQLEKKDVIIFGICYNWNFVHMGAKWIGM